MFSYLEGRTATSTASIATCWVGVAVVGMVTAMVAVGVIVGGGGGPVGVTRPACQPETLASLGKEGVCATCNDGACERERERERERESGEEERDSDRASKCSHTYPQDCRHRYHCPRCLRHRRRPPLALKQACRDGRVKHRSARNIRCKVRLVYRFAVEVGRATCITQITTMHCHLPVLLWSSACLQTEQNKVKRCTLHYVVLRACLPFRSSTGKVIPCASVKA